MWVTPVTMEIELHQRDTLSSQILGSKIQDLGSNRGGSSAGSQCEEQDARFLEKLPERGALKPARFLSESPPNRVLSCG